MIRKAFWRTVVIAGVLTVLCSTTALAAQWKQDALGWWYQNDDGSYPTGVWSQIGGAWYHFDGSGYMQTGWLQDGNEWYYLYPNGSMAVSTSIEGYALDETGKWIQNNNGSSTSNGDSTEEIFYGEES